MGKPTAVIHPIAPFGAGVLIGLSVVTPVFAATGDGFEYWQTAVMIGSIILLVVGVILKAKVTRAGRSTSASEAAPDMRRTRLNATAVDHPMHFGVTPRRQFH